MTPFKRIFFLLAVFFLALFISSAEAQNTKCIEEGDAGVRDGKALIAGGGCGGGGGGGGYYSPYSLQGHVNLNLNQHPHGSGIDGVHMVFQQEGTGQCDGPIDSTVDTYSGGNYFTNITSGILYCITLSKTGYNTVIYTWQTAGSGEVVDWLLQETALAPLFDLPTDTVFTIPAGSPWNVLFRAHDPNQEDLVTLSVVTNTASSWLSCGTSDPQGHSVDRTCSGTPSTGGGPYTVTLRGTDLWNGITDKTIQVTVTNNTPPAWVSPTPADGAVFNFTVGVAIVPIIFKAQDAEGNVTLSNTGSIPGVTYTDNPNPGNPAIRTFSGTPTTVGSYSLHVDAVDTGGLHPTDGIRDITVNVENAPPNSPPAFTVPTTTTFSTPVGDSFSVAFTAQDTGGELVSLSVVGSVPSWLNSFTAPPPANPVSSTFTSKSGRPNASDIGTYTLTVRATDNRTPPLSTDKAITIYVTRFKDVTDTNLQYSNLTTNRTRGADFGDIDNDTPNYDMDLVFGNSLSSELSTRVFTNDGYGGFSDLTTYKLKDQYGFPKAFRNYGVRLGPQNVGQLLNLYFSDWRVSTTNGWHEEALIYRMKNVSGAFQEPAPSDWESPVRIKYSTQWGDIDGTFASDIEVARVASGKVHVFVANSALGEGNLLGGSWYAYLFPSEVLYWSDDTFSRGNVRPFDGGAGNPLTSDFELADVDGDGDLDVFAGGIGYYSGGTLGTNSSSRIWINNGSGSFSLAYTLQGWLTTWSNFNYLEQKGQFADLNGDGRQDLIVTDVQNSPRIYRNTRTANGHGNVSFTRDTNGNTIDNPFNFAGPPYSDAKDVVIGDIDGDSKPDLVFIGDGGRRERVFLNTTYFSNTANNSITFVEATDTILPSITDSSEGGRFFDMDNDGDLDLLIYNTGKNTLYKNKSIP